MTTTDPRPASPPGPGEPAEQLARLAVLEASMVAQLPHLQSAVQALQAYEMRVHATLTQVGVDRAGITGEDVSLAIRSIAAEVGAAMRVSDVTVARRMSDASATISSWPHAHAAFAAGRITRAHLRALERCGGQLCSSDVSADDRAAFEAAMIETAAETTPGRFERIARREADRFLAEPRTLRHQAAREGRRVWVDDEDDGMSILATLMPSVLAHGAYDRLTTGAKAKPKDDPRTYDQWRADAVSELLLAGTTGPADDGETPAAPTTAHALTGIRPTIQITVPVLTLLGHDDRDAPALLDGTIPIDVDTARRLAADAPTWERILTHPITGHALAVDTYTPTTAQRRWLRTRDQHCRWPGCARHARHAEADHTIEWQHGGTTTTSNLASLCRRHHVIKTQTAWRVTQPAPGVLQWRSPAGITYVDEPPRAGPTWTDMPFRPG